MEITLAESYAGAPLQMSAFVALNCRRLRLHINTGTGTDLRLLERAQKMLEATAQSADQTQAAKIAALQVGRCLWSPRSFVPVAHCLVCAGSVAVRHVVRSAGVRRGRQGLPGHSGTNPLLPSSCFHWTLHTWLLVFPEPRAGQRCCAVAASLDRLQAAVLNEPTNPDLSQATSLVLLVIQISSVAGKLDQARTLITQAISANPAVHTSRVPSASSRTEALFAH